MKNPFKITKLDLRYKGVENFTHYINYKVYVPGVTRSFADNCANFKLARIWCWEMFGPSCELNMFEKSTLSQSWAWDTDNNKLRIYVTEPTLSHFMLVHSA